MSDCRFDQYSIGKGTTLTALSKLDFAALRLVSTLVRCQRLELVHCTFKLHLSAAKKVINS